jgi:ribosomal protein S18 acetylase RimI-like enzyme
VLLDDDDQVIGFCLMLETDVDRGNIPLVGVKHRGHQHGLAVVQHSLSQWLAAGRLKVVSATLETDNWPAIAMYRRLGFREWTHYPHVFLARTALSADKLRYKQWCQA